MGYAWRPRQENSKPQFVRKLGLLKQRNTFAHEYFKAMCDGRKIYYTNGKQNFEPVFKVTNNKILLIF